MAKKSESPPIYAFRRGDCLIGEMNADRERIAEIAEGERIRIEVRTGRIPKRLAFYFAFIREVRKATGCAPTDKAFHQAIKLETGFTEDVIFRGHIIKVPASVSFEEMDEQTFGAFLQEALAFIAREYGIVPEDVERAA
ncbi:hypothetical protein RJJ65_32335 [Rhizobium hidalgonense]|uniref:Uncharacterized protein n=1 Tax=Rhizobium hidalgonense TaxID=1538159 RepID=A0AAJ2H1Y2_9HYPH|nr:hypothetical protein [Rhizobium hidalgonense]MDR9777248.1 hypothetical protein [Rhizobium hidalgonense]